MWNPSSMLLIRMELRAPPRLDELFKRFKVFERNKKSLAVKIFAVFDYLERSTYRATARKLTRFFEPVSAK